MCKVILDYQSLTENGNASIHFIYLFSHEYELVLIS